MDRSRIPRQVVYFMSLDNVKWRRPVTPGDQLRFELEVLQIRGHCVQDERRGQRGRQAGGGGRDDGRGSSRQMSEVADSCRDSSDRGDRSPSAELGEAWRSAPTPSSDRRSVGASTTSGRTSLVSGIPSGGKVHHRHQGASWAATRRTSSTRRGRPQLDIGDRTRCANSHAEPRHVARQDEVGTDCLIMAYAHVAHDCDHRRSRDHLQRRQMGGHVMIEDGRSSAA